MVSGIIPRDFEKAELRSEEFRAFLLEVTNKTSAGEGWRERLRLVALDLRSVGQCQTAIAEAIDLFKRIDILLCCTSQAIIGAVEEFGVSPRTRNLVREQFETNYFGPVNIIKAVLPEMRNKTNGHIIILGSITGHLGTPGLGIYCSSNWALEGFCDSLAYEIAPFNIKITIAQASIEIGLLTNRVTSAPMHSAYSPETNSAPLFRGILDGLLNRLPGIKAEYPQSPVDEFYSPGSDHDRNNGPSLLTSDEIVTIYPPLSQAHVERLISETVHCLTAIGGHENPPARHIIGVEGVASVKEKLKTVSEELEDFAEASIAVDFDRPHHHVHHGKDSGIVAKQEPEEEGIEDDDDGAPLTRDTSITIPT